MLERKEILRILQNELADVSNELTAIQDCTFADDAKITIVMKDHKVDLEYSESDDSNGEESYTSLKFEGLSYECLVAEQRLQFQIKTYLESFLKKQKAKSEIHYNQMNFNNIFNEDQKRSFLSSSKIILVVERKDDNVKVSISSAYN